jgi:hypothetical protein
VSRVNNKIGTGCNARSRSNAQVVAEGRGDCFFSRPLPNQFSIPAFCAFHSSARPISRDART